MITHDFHPRFGRTDFGVQTKVQFHFDREALKRHWPEFNRDPMMRAGAYVRVIAIRSIRKKEKILKSTGQVSKKPSPVGHAPYSRYPGHPMRKIFFAREGPLGLTKVVVGAARLTEFKAGSMPVPGIHEHGFIGTRKVLEPPRKFKSPKLGRRFNNSVGRWHMVQDTTTGKWRREYTGGNTFQQLPKRKMITTTVNYPQRPFMMPALLKARQNDRLSQFWRDSIT